MVALPRRPGGDRDPPPWPPLAVTSPAPALPTPLSGYESFSQTAPALGSRGRSYLSRTMAPRLTPGRGGGALARPGRAVPSRRCHGSCPPVLHSPRREPMFWPFTRPARRPASPPRPRVRPGLEALEDRQLLSVSVTQLTDPRSGAVNGLRVVTAGRNDTVTITDDSTAHTTTV